MFGDELGVFKGFIIASSAWNEGSAHGKQQAELLLKKDGLPIDDVGKDIVFIRY